MKLTLQLVVVVLNAPTKFRDDEFNFTFYTIITNKVGGTMPPCSLSNTTFSTKFELQQKLNMLGSLIG